MCQFNCIYYGECEKEEDCTLCEKYNDCGYCTTNTCEEECE